MAPTMAAHMALISVTGNEVKKSAFRPLLPDIHFITLDDPKGLQVIDGQCAAVILENYSRRCRNACSFSKVHAGATSEM